MKLYRITVDLKNCFRESQQSDILNLFKDKLCKTELLVNIKNTRYDL